MTQTMSTSTTTLGDELRRLREQAGLTHGALASEAGINASYLSRIETGKKSCSEDVVRRLDAELGADGALMQRWSTTGPIRTTTQNRRLHQLPSAPERLFGISDVVDQLDQATADTATPVVLTGPAGVGSTALALHWAQHRPRRWPESTLWLPCRGRSPHAAPRSARELVTRLLSDLHTRDLPEDTDRRAALLRGHLRHRRALLLLDDVADADQIRPLLDIPGITVVITARGALPGLALSHHAQHISVPALSTEAARRLLQLILGHQADVAELDRLAAACDRLPLALRASATYALTRGMSTTALADAMTADPLSLLHIATGRDPRTSMWSRLDGSARHLHRTSPGALPLLQQAAVDVHTLTTARAAELTGQPLDEAAQLVDDLAREHLLTPSSHGYNLPHLVSHWAQLPTQDTSHDDATTVAAPAPTRR